MPSGISQRKANKLLFSHLYMESKKPKFTEENRMWFSGAGGNAGQGYKLQL